MMNNAQDNKMPATESANGHLSKANATYGDSNLSDEEKIEAQARITSIAEETANKVNEIFSSIEADVAPKNKALELLRHVVSKYPAESEIKLKASDICKHAEFKPYFKKGDVLTLWREIFETSLDEKEEGDMQPYEREIEPYEGEVNGAELLAEIQERLTRHIVFKNPEIQSFSCALWVLATWCIDSFNFSPYLMITAPEKRCGKSQLLGLLAKLSKKPLETGNLTAPVLFRLVQKHHPTMFIDEADSFLAKDEDLQGVIKCGIERGKALVYRLEKTPSGKFTERHFDCFGMKAISGISAKNISDTITDRCITIELRRKLTSEVMPKVRDVPGELWSVLNAKCSAFAIEAGAWLEKHRPKIPTSISDRDADKWEPLISIADYLDYAFPNEESPNYYGEKVRVCAETLSNIDTDMPLNVELLSDIRDVLNDPATRNPEKEYILTTDLLQALIGNQELRWANFNHGKEMTARQLANHLKVFEIKPKAIKQEWNKRGYMKKDFLDPFKRYLATVLAD